LTRVGVDALVWPNAPFRLVELELSHCFRLTSLPPFPTLRALDVSGCPQLLCDNEQMLSSLGTFKGDFVDGLRSFNAFPNRLERLEVGYCKNLAPEAFNWVMDGNRFRNLTHLRLQRSAVPIDDPLLVSLSTACGANLQELQLYPCILRSEAMFAVGRGMPRLQVLHLAGVWNSANTESLLSVAQGCQRLKSLSLAKLDGDTSDQVFVQLALLPAIRMMDINLHSLSAAGLLEASPFMHSLKALSLRYCSQISSDSLAAVARAGKELTTLDISHTQLGYADVLRTLELCPRLEFLNCTGFHLLPEQLSSLNKSFPQATIHC
jgi:hypothetical protein